MPIIMHPALVVFLVLLLLIYLVPIIVSFTWVRQDADRIGQPGILWAVLSIPFGWLAVLVYVALRLVRAPSPQR
jgi:uncharacterized membrane protein